MLAQCPACAEIFKSSSSAFAAEHRLSVCAPSGHSVRCFFCSGVEPRWAHRLETYVPPRLSIELWICRADRPIIRVAAFRDRLVGIHDELTAHSLFGFE